MKSLKEFVASDNYILAAHRGSSGTAPENTLASFKEALTAGVTLIEADARFTADNHIVAFHDDSIEKYDVDDKEPGDMQYFRRRKKEVLTSQLTLEELRELNLGERYGKGYGDEKVPLLREILDLIRDRAYINIEIKCNEVIEEDKVKRLLKEINDFDYLDKTLFASFNYNILSLIKKLEPLSHIAAVKLPGDKRLPSEIAKILPIEGFICSKEEINDEIFEDCQFNGIIAAVYSLDNEEDLQLLFKYPFKVVVTNYPHLIKELLLKKGINIKPV